MLSARRTGSGDISRTNDCPELFLEYKYSGMMQQINPAIASLLNCVTTNINLPMRETDIQRKELKHSSPNSKETRFPSISHKRSILGLCIFLHFNTPTCFIFVRALHCGQKYFELPTFVLYK